MPKRQKQSEKEITNTELATLILDIKSSLEEKIIDLGVRLSEKIDGAIESLARATAIGFEKVDKQFESVGARLASVEIRLGTVETVVVRTEKRVTDLKERADNIENIVTKTRSDVLNLDSHFVTRSEFNLQ